MVYGDESLAESTFTTLGGLDEVVVREVGGHHRCSQHTISLDGGKMTTKRYGFWRFE